MANEFNPNDLLLPYQKKWVADKSQLKIAEKSRRTGLTWAEAADAALAAASSKAGGGTNHFYVGSNKEMAREFIDAVSMWASAFNYAASDVSESVINDEGKDILAFVIYFASGFKVQALSSNPRNLRGMQGNVTIDEAAFHDQLPEVLKAALALTMWGAKVRLISTHNGVDSEFNQLILDSRAGRKDYSIHTLTIDDACAQGLFKRICQTTKKTWSQTAEMEWINGLLKNTATEEDALEEYYCVPKSSAGSYIPRPMLDRCALSGLTIIRYTVDKKDNSTNPNIIEAFYKSDVKFMELTEHERTAIIKDFIDDLLIPYLKHLNGDLNHSFGSDFARKGDLSIFVACEVLGDTTRKMALTLELINMPYNQQCQILLAMLANMPRLLGIGMDATGNGGFLAEQATIKYGSVMVDAVMLNDPYYREWMPKYKALFESGYIQIPKNEEIINDQRKITVVRGVPKIEKGSEKAASGVQRHGDSAVAYFLAVRASYMEDGVIEFTALPANMNDLDDDGLHSYKDRGCL